MDTIFQALFDGHSQSMHLAFLGLTKGIEEIQPGEGERIYAAYRKNPRTGADAFIQILLALDRGDYPAEAEDKLRVLVNEIDQCWAAMNEMSRDKVQQLVESIFPEVKFSTRKENELELTLARSLWRYDPYDDVHLEAHLAWRTRSEVRALRDGWALPGA